jgi:aconitate hydratase
MEEPAKIKIVKEMLIAKGRHNQVVKRTISITSFIWSADTLEVPILLKMGDDISTDGILKAGAGITITLNIQK